ncbi:hypothetical protein CKO28_20050, partial [Rhodovibrio sodomensis]|nr:hypothetical protein [Rhodovibrio sodomensis]
MQFRTFALGAAGAAAVALAQPIQAEAAPETFEIDPTHTQIAFLIDHLGYSKMLCVDAPADASDFSSGPVLACGQVQSCVRPHDAAVTRRGPVWRY